MLRSWLCYSNGVDDVEKLFFINSPNHGIVNIVQIGNCMILPQYYILSQMILLTISDNRNLSTPPPLYSLM